MCTVLVEVRPDHTDLGLILSMHCRDCLSRILSVCICVLRGRRLFSPVSIEAFVLSPSQGDFAAVGRQSHENSSLDSLSPPLLHMSSFGYHWVICSYTFFFFKEMSKHVSVFPGFSSPLPPHFISVIAGRNQNAQNIMSVFITILLNAIWPCLLSDLGLWFNAST